MRREVGDVFAKEPDRSRGRQKVAGNAVEERGLAGAVGAEHRAPFARFDRQGDVVERGQRTEQARHAAQFKRVCGTRGGEAFGGGLHHQSSSRVGAKPLSGLGRIGFPAFPQAEQAVGREEHDGEEADADEQMEPLAVKAERDQDIEGKGAQEHIDEGADERSDRPAQAADHRDDSRYRSPGRCPRCRARSVR